MNPMQNMPDVWISIVACVLLVALYYAVRYYRRMARMDRLLSAIHSPKGSLPILGHALLLNRGEPWSQMRLWAQEAGKMVTFNVMGQRVLYVNDPALLKRMLQTHQRIYRKDLATSYSQFMCLLGKGLVTSEDEAWRKGRMLLTHALRYDLVQDIPPIAMQAVGRLKTMLAEATGVVDLGEEFRRLTLQVIGEAVLSLSPEECDALFPPLYLPIVVECNKRVWAPWRAAMPWIQGHRERRRCLKKLNSSLCDIIRERWAKRTAEKKRGEPATRRQDMLDLCMSRFEVLDAVMVEQLRDEIKTMLLAGHETSAAMLTWATYELFCHPNVACELRKEFEAVIRPTTEAGGVPTVEQVKSLRWTPAVLRETLRKYSVVPCVVRLPCVDDVIPAADSGLGFDFTVPKGVSVMLGIEGVHHRPDIWPTPDRFLPQRFLGYNPDISNASPSPNAAGEMIDPYSFIPFIQGPRNCLGQHVSLMETQIVLSCLLGAIMSPVAQADGSVTFDMNLELAMDPVKAGERHDYEVPITPKHGLLVVRKGTKSGSR